MVGTPNGKLRAAIRENISDAFNDNDIDNGNDDTKKGSIVSVIFLLIINE
jgi:hypothetical protein